MQPSPADLDAIHLFWFGELSGPEAEVGERMRAWFARDDAFDAAIRERFGAMIAPAAEASWDLAALSRTQQVGLVILLDQFPRNVFRSSAESFAYDAKARAVAGELIASGIDRFYLAERMFLLLPEMHSEDIDDQDRCVLRFAEEVVKAPTNWKGGFRNGLDFAIKHRDLIVKFGRFPHRNEALGRETTADEAAFLSENGRGF